MVFVPGAAAITALFALLTLAPLQVGRLRRDRDEAVTSQPNYASINGDERHDSGQTVNT